MHETTPSSPASVPARNLLSGSIAAYWPVVVVVACLLLSFESLFDPALLAGAGIVFLCACHGRTLLRQQHFHIDRTDVLIVVLIILELIAYTQSTLHYNSRPFLQFVMCAILMYGFFRHAAHADSTRRCLYWAMKLLAVYWIVLTIQKATGTMATLKEAGFDDLSQFRNVYSPYIGSNEWTLFLLLLLPWPVLSGMRSTSPIPRIVSVMICAGIAWCILLCFSRGGYVALLAFMCILGTGIYFSERALFRTFLKGAFLAGALAVTAMIPHHAAVKTTLLMNETMGQQRSTDSRWRMWTVGKDILATHPLFGTGAYTFALAYNVMHKRTADEAPVGRVTSAGTQVIAEKGIVGILIALALLAGLCISCIGFLRRPPTTASSSDRMIVVAGIATLAAVCIREATVSTLLHRSFVFILFVITMSPVLSVAAQHWRPLRFTRFQVTALMLPVFFLTGLVLWHEYDHRKWMALHRETVRSLRSSSYDKAMSSVKKAALHIPDHPVAFIHAAAGAGRYGFGDSAGLAHLFYCPGDPNTALDHLQQAATIEPRDETIAFAIGWVYAGLKDWSRAEENFLTAIRIDPTVSLYPLGLALACETQGKANEAKDALARVLALDPAFYLSACFADLIQRDPSWKTQLPVMALRHLAGSEDPISRARAGTISYFTGDHVQAASLLQSAIDDLPGMNRPYYYLGEIALAKSDTAQTLALWKKSLFLDPGDHLVHARMRQIEPMHFESGEPRRTEPMFAKRKVFYPGIPLFANTLLSPAFMEYIQPAYNTE